VCLATPVQVKTLDGQFAEVDHDGQLFKVNIVLIQDLKVGDWIMAHGDLGVNKMPEADALEILELSKSHDHCHCPE